MAVQKRMLFALVAVAIVLPTILPGVLPPAFAKNQVSTRQHGTQDSAVKSFDEYLSQLAQRDSFSGAVLIAKEDQVLLSKGYGYANIDWDIRNQADTRFRIASISKQMTAVGVLLLHDRKRLDLEDAVGKHINDLPKDWQSVTVRQLLNHTSGIPSYTEAVALREFALSRKTLAQIIDVTKDKPMDFKTGTQMRYNNTAYILAGLLIERVSGKSYGQFC
jgi:CubicO group peptidase (beta-lactamase class C family)